MNDILWVALSVAALSISEAYAKKDGKGKSSSSGSSSGGGSGGSSGKIQTTKCRDGIIQSTSTACKATLSESTGSTSHTKKVIGIVLACVIPTLCLLTIFLVHRYYSRRKRRDQNRKPTIISKAEYQELLERLDLTTKDTGHETVKN